VNRICLSRTVCEVVRATAFKNRQQDSKELFGIHSGDKALFLDTDTMAKIGIFAQSEGSLAEDIQIFGYPFYSARYFLLPVGFRGNILIREPMGA